MAGGWGRVKGGQHKKYIALIVHVYSVQLYTTHQRSGFFGFFKRDFSKMALALVSCPTFSSSLDSKSHRGVEWGHFFNCLKESKQTMVWGNRER